MFVRTLPGVQAVLFGGSIVGMAVFPEGRNRSESRAPRVSGGAFPVLASSAARVRRGVIGILSRNSEYLLIKRAPGVPKGGCWCFPGGHVERNETPRKAVRRELLEELGIQVEPTIRLGSVRVHDSRHILVVWKVDHVAGVFRLAEKEIADIAWLPLDGIFSMQPGLASNAVVVEMLRRGHAK